MSHETKHSKSRYLQLRRNSLTPDLFANNSKNTEFADMEKEKSILTSISDNEKDCSTSGIKISDCAIKRDLNQALGEQFKGDKIKVLISSLRYVCN